MISYYSAAIACIAEGKEREVLVRFTQLVSTHIKEPHLGIVKTVWGGRGGH